MIVPAYPGRLALASVLAFVPFGSGCREKEAGFDVVSLTGRVEKIEPNADSPDTGRITVRYKVEKHPDEQVRQGVIARETEVLINGAVAKLGDLMVGEEIRADVRVPKPDDGQLPVVLKIRVERSGPATTDG